MQLQPKSNEGLIKQLKKDCLTRTQLLIWVRQLNFTTEQENQLEKFVSKIVEDKLDEALAQKDKEVAEAVKAERSRIEIELMSAEKHSHPFEPTLFLQWSDLKKALTPKE